jgi:hypothetical protein
MVAAILGLVGVILGLAIGRGYGFWSSRRDELAETIVALAVIEEELRNVQARQDPKRLEDAWREHRKWLVIHFSPDDYRLLADAIEGRGSPVFEPADLAGRLGALYSLFWEEHEAFILVPLIHYLKGNTVSKRVRAILDPARDPSVGSLPAIKSWHSPRRDPSRGS